MKGRNLTDAEVARLAELYETGLTMAAAGECLGLSAASVRTALDRLGIAPRPSSSPIYDRRLTGPALAAHAARATRGWARRRVTEDARIGDRIDRSAGPAGCWIWTGGRQTLNARGKGGYGHFRRNGRRVYVHRWALEQAIGRRLAEDEVAMHSCDNPPCVNPAHLSVGSVADNARDMVAKGRHANQHTRRVVPPPESESELRAAWGDR